MYLIRLYPYKDSIEKHVDVWLFVTPKLPIWVVVSNIFCFHPYLGKITILTHIFQMGLKPPSSNSWILLQLLATMYLFDHRNNPTETFEGRAAAAKISLAAGARGARLGAVVVWRGDRLMRRLGEGLYTDYQDCLVKVGWPSPRSLAYNYI